MASEPYRSPNPHHRSGRTWEEFKWDMQHPRELARAVWAGMNGRNPELSESERWIGFAMIFVGALQIVLGLSVILS